MSEMNSCRICKFSDIKKTLFGGTKCICTKTNEKMNENNICNSFVKDLEKVMFYSGFRYRKIYSDEKSCDYCVYHVGRKGNDGYYIYGCTINNVEFIKGYRPYEHICNNFKDGGFDALLNSFVEAVDEFNSTKGKDD